LRRARIAGATQGSERLAQRIGPPVARLPIGWLLEDPEGVLLTVTGPGDSHRQACGATAEAAWWAMAEVLTGIGEGRMLPGTGTA